MNKQLLSLAVILSLGTVGCAGFGLQQSSSLSAEFQKQQGLDELWSVGEATPQQGLETPRYAEQELSHLWNEDTKDLQTVRDDGSAQTPNRGDLWNPASVSRSWEINEDSKPAQSRGLIFGNSGRGGIWY